jgi:hypothetical protein
MPRRKKPSRKKVAKKPAGKKAARKKKTSTRKTAGKKTTRKKVTRKPAARRTAAKKKTAKTKAVKKKVVRKKAVEKRTAGKKVTRKKAVTRAAAGPRLPRAIDNLFKAVEEGNPARIRQAVEALSATQLGELIDVLPWSIEAGERLLEAMNRRGGEFQRVAAMLADRDRPPLDVFLKCCFDPAFADEFRELLLCLCDWCRCCGSWPCRPPWLCRCCYGAIRVYPRAGMDVAHHRCATSLKFTGAGVQVSQGDSPHQSLIQISGGGGGIARLDDVGDVNVAAPANRQVLAWDMSGVPAWTAQTRKRVVTGQVNLPPGSLSNVTMPDSLDGASATNTCVVASGYKTVNGVTTPLAVKGMLLSPTSIGFEVWDVNGQTYNPAAPWDSVVINYAVIDK